MAKLEEIAEEKLKGIKSDVATLGKIAEKRLKESKSQNRL